MTASAADVATNQHYDLDPEIFAAFLDPSRKYSAGLWSDGAVDLADAQRRKLAFVTGRLGVGPGARVLDVGCGWGALTLHLAAQGCSAVGVTPAARQQDHVRATAAARGLGGQVEVVHGEIEHLDRPRGEFDAAAALGSVVHMPDLVGVLTRVRRMLRRGGRCYVSESCFRSAGIAARHDEAVGTEFVRHRIFGNGTLRPLSELVAAAEAAGFSVAAVDDLTDDYRRTIDAWIANVEVSADEIDARSPGMADDLVRYLQVANAGWGFTTKHYALTLVNRR